MPFLLDATLTGYYPIDDPIEGGPNDCAGRKLITLQQHLSDPATYPYAAVAGDCDAWPDGQRISIPEISPEAVFRIVDTGGHFHGANKVIRNPGREPFDVCLDPGTSFGVVKASVIVYPGDDFGRGVCPKASVCGNEGDIDLATVVATPVGLAGKSVLAVGVGGLLLAAGVTWLVG
jgi:hypothetical protein